MQISLSGKNAWVTGASEGIGRSIARQLARCGARVALTARDASELKKVLDEIEQLDGTAFAVPADVSSPDEMQAAQDTIKQKWKHLDTLVANAGINGTWAPIDEITYEEWSQTVGVNLTGTYLTLHHAIPLMTQPSGGSIALISSINGTRVFSNEGASAYAATKAAQLTLGKMCALELSQRKIRVNVVCPGAFATGIHDKTEKEDLASIETPVEFPEGKIPLTDGQMGDPVQVANLVAFLASDYAQHITGTPVWIDGGQSLLMG